MLSLNKLLSHSDFSENGASAIFTDVLLDNRLFIFLQFIELLLKKLNLGNIQVIGEFGDDISLNEDWKTQFNNQKCRLSLQKKQERIIIISERYFNSLFQSSKEIKKTYNLVFSCVSFRTKQSVFWCRSAILNKEYEQLEPLEQWSERDNYCVSLNDEAFRFLPSDYAQWVAQDGKVVPLFWSKVAACKLLTLIGAEVLLRDQELQIAFRGDKRILVNTNLSLNNLEKAYSSICKITEWIYQESREEETRHSIFNNQVCLASISDTKSLLENFDFLGPILLENSKLAYRYYLVDNNKEFVKSLTDLNKTLFDHISKIRQNTVDVVSNLWRDFATAFALLIVNFSLKKSDISPRFWDVLLAGLIIYLILSFFLNSSIGYWFYKKLRDSLNDVRNRLYAYLSDDDFNKFAMTPLNKAQGKFNSTVCWVAGAYVTIIFFVLRLINLSNLKFWH